MEKLCNGCLVFVVLNIDKGASIYVVSRSLKAQLAPNHEATKKLESKKEKTKLINELSYKLVVFFL